MDRKSNKKIGKYFGVYLAFAILFSAGMYLLAKYEVSVKQQQMLILLTHHPELESEIISLWEKPLDIRILADEDSEKTDEMVRMVEEKYGYDFDSTMSSDIIYVFWGTGLLIGAAAAGILWYLNYRKIAQSAGTREELQEFYECLQRFREGDFRDIPDAPEESEEWMKLCETLRELGIYFESLKMRLAEEEDSTKALITDISHQLKTPLASLRMSYELVAGENLTDEERSEFQAQEEREIEKLEMLLNELVNLSRLETHMIQIRPARGSLKKTITNAVSQIYMKARSKNIELQVDMEEDMEICHDAKWTAEAIENVLDNAVKYSDGGTLVTVRVRPLVRNVLIEVEDEGMGIRTEELNKIYHRFYRGNEASKKVKEGAGVGLYLARRILEQQGGTISAKRKSGRGTIFKITLPC